MSEAADFIRIDGEPEPVCANCDSFSINHKCANRMSVWFHFSPMPSDGCERFFPDPKRWPEADHG